MENKRFKINYTLHFSSGGKFTNTEIIEAEKETDIGLDPDKKENVVRFIINSIEEIK